MCGGGNPVRRGARRVKSESRRRPGIRDVRTRVVTSGPRYTGCVARPAAVDLYRTRDAGRVNRWDTARGVRTRPGGEFDA